MRFDSKNVVELVGLIGLIASLIFVGLEVQQNSEATRSATVLQIKGAWVELNIEQATSLELNDAFQDVDENGFANASIVNQAAIGGFYRALFHNLSSAYYQYRIGTLDEELWLPHLAEIRTFRNDPKPIRIWRDWNHLYDEPFWNLVNSELEPLGE